MRFVIPTQSGRIGSARTVRAGTRGKSKRSKRSLRVDGVNGKLIPQDRGRGNVVHGGGGGHTALKDLVSTEGKGGMDLRFCCAQGELGRRRVVASGTQPARISRVHDWQEGDQAS